MRYALRNKKKIEAAYPGMIKVILRSLDKHFTENTEIVESLPSNESEPYNLLLVDHIEKSKSIIVFYIIKIKFDVYRLAFKEFIG